MEIKNFKNDNHSGFDVYFEKKLEPNEVVYLKMPTISLNKRSVNDIGWQCENETTIYATLSNQLSGKNENEILWTEIQNEQDINKCTQFLKICAGNEGGIVYVRANLN